MGVGLDSANALLMQIFLFHSIAFLFFLILGGDPEPGLDESTVAAIHVRYRSIVIDFDVVVGVLRVERFRLPRDTRHRLHVPPVPLSRV